MARCPRKKSYTKVYHIIIRGINKQDIFLDNQDLRKFRKEIKRVKEKYKFEIYAYAFMSNHIHLIIKDENENLELIMKSLTVSYSNYFNKKYERIGHLFENRFKSHAIEDESYLKNVVRYVHKNLFTNNMDNFKAYHNIYEKYQDYDKNYEMISKLQDEDAIKLIRDILKEPNLIKIQHYDKDKRNEVISKILKIEGITKVQIARILGMNRKTISRIENQKG